LSNTEILHIFEDAGALLKGHFLLSSGLHSGQYLQCALVLERPKYAERLCGQLASKFAGDNVSVVIGPALGGIIVSYETARALGCRSIFTERKDGSMVLRRGFKLDKKDRVLVVEDVITTGTSTKEVMDIVKESGARLIGLAAIIDRTPTSINRKMRLESLLKIDMPTFKPQDCPLCRDGVALVKPGSR